MDEHNRGSREHGEEFWRAAVERIRAGEKVRVVAGELGVDVLQHRTIPPNDGGISIGQAAIAAFS